MAWRPRGSTAWPASWAPSASTARRRGRVAGWRSRWWSLWGCTDLVPMGEVVMQVAPAQQPPFDAASIEMAVTGPDRGTIRRASGYHSPGQGVRLVRDARGRPVEFWSGGTRLVPRAALVAEATRRYRGTRRR